MVSRNNRFSRRRFALEQLETRELMAADAGFALDADLFLNHAPAERGPAIAAVAGPKAIGNITATLAGGNLYLSEGDRKVGLKHGVAISQLSNGHILVSGHDPTNSGSSSTLINGQAAVEFAVTGSLFVNLGGGEDQIIFDTSAGAIPTFQDVVLDTGTDSAADRIIMWNLNTRGSLNIDTWGGDDWIHLGGVTIGDGFGFDQLTVNSGAGADSVTLKSTLTNQATIHGWVDIQTYSTLSETDADVVYFDKEAAIDRNLDVRTGGGDDILLVTEDLKPVVDTGGLIVGGSLAVDLGAGNDRGYARGVRVGGNFTFYTGAGADNVTIDNRFIVRSDGTYFLSRVGGNVEVQTYAAIEETDRDEVRILDATIDGSLMARLGGGDDFFLMDDADYIANDLNVDMGAGSDEAEVSAFVLDHLMIWMGEGDDILRLGKTSAYRLIADGSSGIDSLTKSYNTSATFVDLFGWESVNG